MPRSPGFEPSSASAFQRVARTRLRACRRIAPSFAFILYLFVAPVVLVAQRFDRVLTLQPNERIFAYARVSSDGRLLAYTSGRGSDRTVIVTDLYTHDVLFAEAGMDAFFSPNDLQLVYLGYSQDGTPAVNVYDLANDETTRDMAPVELGDYLSWGKSGSGDVILTIEGNYFFLRNSRAVLPHSRIPPCPGIGVGDRPLLSKDGRRVTTFVQGAIVVRNLDDCESIIDTGVQGGKADFSWDGRFVAFHTLKPSGDGYEIAVIDLDGRTIRTVTDLPGSSYFPSWTKDGRLVFRYEASDYQGFLLASDVLAAAPRPLPVVPRRLPRRRSWRDIFEEQSRPSGQLLVTLIWGPFSAHSSDALVAAERARNYFGQRGFDVEVIAITEPGSKAADAAAVYRKHTITLPQMRISAEGLRLTEAHNQIPAVLLFRDQELIDYRLGAQTFEQLQQWICSVLSEPARQSTETGMVGAQGADGRPCGSEPLSTR